MKTNASGIKKAAKREREKKKLMMNCTWHCNRLSLNLARESILMITIESEREAGRKIANANWLIRLRSLCTVFYFMVMMINSLSHKHTYTHNFVALRLGLKFYFYFISLAFFMQEFFFIYKFIFWLIHLSHTSINSKYHIVLRQLCSFA